MKDIPKLLLLALVLCLTAVAQVSGSLQTAAPAPSANGLNPGRCTRCAIAVGSSGEGQTPMVKPIPGSNEMMLVGPIENLIPIGVLTVLGCEKCSAEAVKWALQQGSSFEDVERTLRTVAAMQKLDCFKNQFGPDVAARMEKPLAAANQALMEARMQAAK